MSIASWTFTLAAAGFLIHALNKRKADEPQPDDAQQAPAGDAYSTTDPVSGRVKPEPAMRADEDEVQPGLSDFARGA